MVRARYPLLVLGAACVALCIVSPVAAQPRTSTPVPVKVWEETITLPTYVTGPPEPNPMFYFGRASQGAEGRIYPYPLYDNLTEEKEARDYRIVYLENEYVKIGILPEIGGRVWSGRDKTNGYDFLYRQHVVKPALIGLTGAWISGGIEWNIPHHHRATTFTPVQYRIEENADGSATVWVGELELRHRMRWAVGHTLRPGRSYLEATIRIHNRTPLPHTMLAFANVAVHASRDYQIIFPPSTQYVTHHHKREFTTWPVATTRYGNADFRSGVDVSWYRNHRHANSMFAWNYTDDFFAGYDHGRGAGTMSVADHHVVPGKKFWTWGTGPRGQMWEEILTDEDGPYVELMIGAYSDNQPDYSWLQPFEGRSATMYLYPFRGIDGVKKGNLEAAVNLEVDEDGGIVASFHTTAAHPHATVEIRGGNHLLLRETVSIDPGHPFVEEASLPTGTDPHDVEVSLRADGRALITYSPERRVQEPMPDAVKPPRPPEAIRTVEELFLTGQRIDQFHSPALDPEPYWEEAIRRDPGNSRVNTALGVLALRRGQHEVAEGHFRRAVARITDQHTAPKDAEALYYLGVALKAQGNVGEAYDTFSRAAWSVQWRGASHYVLAELATLDGDLPRALDHLNRSIEVSAHNLRALDLKATVLRHLGRRSEARRLLDDIRAQTDPLDVRHMTEGWLLAGGSEVPPMLASTLRDHPAVGLETAVEYMNAGLWDDAGAVLKGMMSLAPLSPGALPLVYYYRGYVAEHQGMADEAGRYFRAAAEQSSDYVFPFQHEVIPVLRRAMEVNPGDARAPYYLGNLLYDWQPDEAIRLWETSATLDPSNAIVHRNLALAWSHDEQEGSLERAIESMERAVSLSDDYPIHLFELDRLYEAAGRPPQDRLAMLEAHAELVVKRDDATARAVSLKIFMGKADEAIAMMTGRVFDIWEGGARFNPGDAWTDAHLQRGRQRLASGAPGEALADFETALRFPPNIRAERTEGSARRQAEVSYWIGVAREALGERDQSREAWRDAANVDLQTQGSGSAVSVSTGVQLYHQALALESLGREEESREIFRQVKRAGEALLAESASTLAFFSSFGERQSQRARLASAHYLVGLGHEGLGEEERAIARFRQALEASPDHLGSRTALETASQGTPSL